MGDKAKEFQETINTIMGKLFLEHITNDREALEDAALEAVCACDYYDLADTLHETLDEDLMAIVTRVRPCKVCGA